LEAGGSAWEDNIKRGFLTNGLSMEMRQTLVTLQPVDDFVGYCRQLQKTAESPTDSPKFSLQRGCFPSHPFQLARCCGQLAALVMMAVGRASSCQKHRGIRGIGVVRCSIPRPLASNPLRLHFCLPRQGRGCSHCCGCIGVAWLGGILTSLALAASLDTLNFGESVGGFQ
jgi:hypothetical protein